MKLYKKWTAPKLLITLGILPLAVFMLSGLIIKAEMVWGSCVPYEDLTRGGFLCGPLSLFRLFYIVLMSMFGVAPVAMVIVGFLWGTYVYLSKKRSLFLEEETRNELKKLLVFVIAAFIYIAFVIYSMVHSHLAVQSFIAQMESRTETLNSMRTNFENIPLLAERYKSEHGSYENFCSSESLREFYNTIQESEVKCFDSKETYKMYTSLPYGSEVYWCIDNDKTIVPVTKINTDEPLCRLFSGSEVSAPTTTQTTDGSDSTEINKSVNAEGVKLVTQAPNVVIQNESMSRTLSLLAPTGWTVNRSGLYGTQEIWTDPTSSNQANIYVVPSPADDSTLNEFVTRNRTNLTKVYQNYKPTSTESVYVSGVEAKLIGATYSDNGVDSEHLQLIVVEGKTAYIVSATTPITLWESRESKMRASLLSANLK